MHASESTSPKVVSSTYEICTEDNDQNSDYSYNSDQPFVECEPCIMTPPDKSSPTGVEAPVIPIAEDESEISATNDGTDYDLNARHISNTPTSVNASDNLTASHTTTIRSCKSNDTSQYTLDKRSPLQDLTTNADSEAFSASINFDSCHESLESMTNSQVSRVSKQRAEVKARGFLFEMELAGCLSKISAQVHTTTDSPLDTPESLTFRDDSQIYKRRRVDPDSGDY